MERAELVPAPGERRLYEFGEFRVDPVRRRLLKDGEAIAVTSKAFSLLVVLLERRGEVVGKEELFRRVWPDTYVTEANLTQNVSSLRKALGERAGDRRYILTVPGRGYTFIAEVREISADASGVYPLIRLEEPPPARTFPVAAAVPRELGEPEPGEPEASAAPEILEETGASSREPAAPLRIGEPGLTLRGGILLLLLGIFSLLLAPGAPMLRTPPKSAAASATSSQRPALAVLGLKDLSENPQTGWLSVALAEMLTTELSAGGQARLISGDNVTRIRQSLAIPDTESLRDADLKRLQTILGADHVVVGSYLILERDGRRQIRLDVRVLELPEGTVVETLTEVGDESHLLEIVSRVGRRLRQVFGLGELSRSQSRSAQALHPSAPEAARLAAQGLERLRSFDFAGANVLLERAAGIEPGSPFIHALLARVATETGDDPRALREARLALDLSRSLPLPREERLAIEARFYAAAKQWPQAAELYRSLWTFFPDEIDHGLQLAIALINAGRSGEALEVLTKLRQSPVGGRDPRIDLEEARAASRIGDLAALFRVADAAESKSRLSGERQALARALIWQGVAQLEAGRPQEAVVKFREAEELAREVGQPWTTGMALSNLGRALQALGELDEAELRHQQSLDIARQLGSAVGIAAQLYTLATLHHARGDLGEGLRLLEEARTAYIEIGDRLMQGRALTGMAQILLQQGNVDAARHSAEEAVAAAREVGNRGDEAKALEILASVLAWQGEIAGADRQLETALHLLLDYKRPALATSVLASSANTLARLGNLTLAQRRLEQAAAAERRAGDKMATAHLLGARSRLALQSGDVAQARAQSETLLRLARETGARVFEARALHELGRAQRAAGDLPAAGASLQASLRKSEETGDASWSAVTRLEMARLMLSADRSGEAAVLARDVAAWAAPRSSPWLEAQALAVMAEALLREGRTREAREAGERSRELVRATQDREIALLLTAPLARVDAATGDVDGAIGELNEAIAAAEQSGLVSAALEARLALGEIELRAERGEQTLAALRRDAQTYGFKDLVRRAGAGG